MPNDDGVTQTTAATHDARPPCFKFMPVKERCEACRGVGFHWMSAESVPAAVLEAAVRDKEGQVKVWCEPCSGDGQIKIGYERVVGGKHKGEWIWVNGEMTSRLTCKNCGVEWDSADEPRD